MSKFHALHYNFVAKRLRNHYPMDSVYGERTVTRLVENTAVRRVIENIALEFAQKFLKDNPGFDPVKFLDQCSPDKDLYPLSELWEIQYENHS